MGRVRRSLAGIITPVKADVKTSSSLCAFIRNVVVDLGMGKITWECLIASFRFDERKNSTGPLKVQAAGAAAFFHIV